MTTVVNFCWCWIALLTVVWICTNLKRIDRSLVLYKKLRVCICNVRRYFKKIHIACYLYPCKPTVMGNWSPTIVLLLIWEINSHSRWVLRLQSIGRCTLPLLNVQWPQRQPNTNAIAITKIVQTPVWHCSPKLKWN